jgi:alkyl sulfatase BDS1-like metallo-beta-lactamase superfamily hydrolase
MRESSIRDRAVRAIVAIAVAGGAVHAQSAQQVPVPNAAAPAVRAVYDAALRDLPFADQQDFADARRGFIATLPAGQDTRRYGFLNDEKVPDTVHPSLWRLARLNAINGLFEVVPGVYQVRGLALANVTFIEGATGVIVVDPLGSVGAARASIDLYFAHRPKRPVVAVIYTHSHSDHYGGVRGVVDEAEVAAGRTAIIGPAGFMDAVIAESVVAGNAMGRRAIYQFGASLPRGERGSVDAGLGKIDGVGALGRSVMAPTMSVTQSFETHTIDGVPIVFQLTPATEAPAELHMFLPRHRVLNLAENATKTMHNLLPFRGTEVRDSSAWSKYLGAALERFGPDTDVLIAQHHWPTWGRERVGRALANQRDLYKYIHDQSVRLMNHGYMPSEISEELVLPPGLANDWATRGYYGTLSHNAKAVYQKYLGWYDGNPANLNPLPERDASKKYVEYFGGVAAVMAKARADYAKGEYRWVAEVMRHVVYAEPSNTEARHLAADAFEQLGYAAEAATWRNAYLVGAQELRQGPLAARVAVLDPEMVRAMRASDVFDVLGTHVNGPRAWSREVVVNWSLTGRAEQLVVTLRNGALTYVSGARAANASAAVTLSRETFEGIVLGRQSLAEAAKQGAATVEGELAAATFLFEVLDRFDAAFSIVEPRRPR